MEQRGYETHSALRPTSVSVAVILSTFNEVRYIDRALDAILAQTVSPHVVIVDGGSNDGTTTLLRYRAAVDDRITLVCDGVHRSLPHALNVALDMTEEPFVAKVDARTFIAPDFLERALAVFEHSGPDLACVGGRPEQHGETNFGEGLARARMSRFGVGASGYADPRDWAEVDSVQCGIYRRSALLELGGFDRGLQFGEDEELNWRLRRRGYRIVRDNSIRFVYITRPTWKGAFRQYRNYGFARVKVWRKHREFLRPHHLIPSFAVITGAALLAAAAASPALRPVALGAGVAYALAACTAALWATRDKPQLVPHTAAAFAALHLGYGIGLLQALMHGVRERRVSS